MASPRYEVFFIFDVFGAPVTGATPTFTTYKDSSGGALAAPAIAEIGGGAYRFLPVFADPTKGIVYVINTGANNYPERYYRYIRPEDWIADTTHQYLTGKWVIQTAGPDKYHLVCYDEDGATQLYKFELRDAAGSLTITNPFTRTPV